MSKLDLEHKNPKSQFLMTSGSFFGTLSATLCGHSSFLAPFRRRYGLFLLAFSAVARLELQGEPFQHHFVDLVSFLGPLLRIFDALLLKTYKILGGRLAPLRGRGRAAGAARRPLRRHFPFLFCG